MSNGFQASDSDGFVYRVTREKSAYDYAHPDFRWGMNYFDMPKRWIRTTNLCSKRSAAQQVKFLLDTVRSAKARGHEPRERLISVGRAPFSVFEDVTSDFTG